ncbi:prolipoprotein diacylglyceryl transferase [Spirochaeta cellobiosiphila]|uniref:prolipoprotein diacylglyceryl transferase n=1 Tax=Spirochaeta cellobiosiphila TaxID=504483 RepID=UPI0004087485|nr:prolipoprotein diacylglyceryl transferase [Spirochaeta cellobiosiphila]
MLAYLNYPSWIKPEIIPGLPIRWYGLMYLVAFAIAYYLLNYQIKQKKLNTQKDIVSDYVTWVIVGVIVGARIFATLVYDTSGRYWTAPWLIFWPFQNGHFTGLAGMSYHGGVIGGTIAAVIFSKIKKMDVLVWGDMLVTSIPLGYTFGRIGNFLNGELYGRVTTAPWGVIFPNAEKFDVNQPWVKDTMNRLNITIANNMDKINLPRHPSQLYEALFEGVILWLLLWFVIPRFVKVRGGLISFYLIGYGFFRFVIEYFREPDVGMDFPIMFGVQNNPNYLFQSLFNFTTGQILCFLMILGGIISYIAFVQVDRKTKK